MVGGFLSYGAAKKCFPKEALLQKLLGKSVVADAEPQRCAQDAGPSLPSDQSVADAQSAADVSADLQDTSFMTTKDLLALKLAYNSHPPQRLGCGEMHIRNDVERTWCMVWASRGVEWVGAWVRG